MGLITTLNKSAVVLKGGDPPLALYTPHVCMCAVKLTARYRVFMTLRCSFMLIRRGAAPWHGTTAPPARSGSPLACHWRGRGFLRCDSSVANQTSDKQSWCLFFRPITLLEAGICKGVIGSLREIGQQLSVRKCLEKVSNPLCVDRPL